MLFNSIEFLFFLPIVFVFYWFVFKSLKWQNLFIVIASYVFYGWWDWRFLLLIALTTVCSYISGLLLLRYKNDRHKSLIVCVGNVVLNLSILGVFKYYNFFVENLALLVKSFGYDLGWTTINIILPVGISFYTFQALSYTIDVYRGKMEPTKDPISFFAFISFFPQLVAGPIERATNLLPQFLQRRNFNYEKAIDGCRQILWGLLKKMIIADNCAEIVNLIWDNYTDYSGLTLLIGGILFSFQIYCDFSGYSDIAIGTAKLFGIRLMQNFNLPYLSRSIPEFWRRWHISLTTWFRDYIYFPLGGNRVSQIKTLRNTMIVFGVSGLWHGANWTFICWGLYHALLFIPYMLLHIDTKHQLTVEANRLLPSFKGFIQMCITFFLAVIGWILFRSDSMSQAVDYIYRMFMTITQGEVLGKRALVYCFLLVVIEWLQRNKAHCMQIDNPPKFLKYRVVRWTIYYILIWCLVAMAGSQQDFIYFQF
ncbi:MAG: MBOAT family O-acyltransferase [Prevotella sp.]|nr:MBOAT family O-acyltransferase [Prevotella sp.]